jgi:CO/xanthine dehydrogenase FAD-binding subunit
MPANIREFHRAPTTARALELLKRTETPTTALVVGPRLPDPPFAQAEAVVDLQALPLNTLTVAGDAIRTGALVDLQTLVTSAPLAAVADGILVEAATLAAHFGLRNLATVAGAIDGATEDPPGPPEVLLALLALGAEVTLAGGSVEPSPLARYSPAKHTMLQEVTIPVGASWRGALARVARSPRDQAIVAAVAAVSATTARVAVAGASAAPIVVETRIQADRAEVVAHLATAVAERTDPKGDYRGSVAYRRAMAEVLARRALNQAFSNGTSA